MDWITDRLPTKADADDNWDVIVLSDSGKTWYSLHWGAVRLGRSWLPFIPPTGSKPSVPTSQPRPIVSITLDADSVAAVADDGTAWWLSADGTKWTQLPALPQREIE